MDRPHDPEATDVFGSYPITTMFILYGLGLGLGVALSHALCHPMLRRKETLPTRIMHQLGKVARHAPFDALVR